MKYTKHFIDSPKIPDPKGDVDGYLRQKQLNPAMIVRRQFTAQGDPLRYSLSGAIKEAIPGIDHTGTRLKQGWHDFYSHDGYTTNTNLVEIKYPNPHLLEVIIHNEAIHNVGVDPEHVHAVVKKHLRYAAVTAPYTTQVDLTR